ncbi:HxlR family transcriptional regulator [Actinomadura pelletieri DSM 43383]|uniref:HxlR family transcriptional regulator n=1 Tax=Actinomadura pelletieri DSM 43383 TaxID=1120940 RepID=A0A495QSH2_9ACTN|nr:helix-turn-helix domain-containing protein [Actinomadura pelletieri]RKS76351.1 HxlR family transcriptional regulator [Actinomadura pelletieri DSM 43383]
MGASYYQFCPVAKAMELLDERWTLLIVRELLSGSERFNELRRGVPRMSPTLLSKRLNQLVRAGVVERRAEGNDARYVLTPAGEELRPVVEALAVWGVRWIGELGDQDLDPRLLMWDMRRKVDHEAVPDGRTVIEFVFPDVPARERCWWLVVTPGEADVCDADPGFDVSVTITADLRQLTRVWRRDLPWSDALRTGAVQVRGPEELRRAVPGWFTQTLFPTVHHGGRMVTRR